MTSSVEQLLSEFMDAWSAGRGPDPGDFLARASPDERAVLAGEIDRYLDWAPDPAYGEATLRAIEQDPVVRQALARADRDRTLWPELLPALRRHLGASTADVASALVRLLGVRGGEGKARRYLEEMEDGTLPPRGVQGRVFDALGRLFRMPAGDLRAAGDLGGWEPSGAFARAEPAGPPPAVGHLEVAADLLGTPAPAAWDEVDDLFRGGRAGA